MPIPDIEVFNELLSTFTLRQPEPASDFEHLEAVPRRVMSDLSQVTSSEPIFLWYRKSCTLSSTRLVRTLCKELDRKGHTSTSEMARTILAILCLTSSSHQSPVARLNAIIEMIGRADSSQFWISPYPPHPDSKSYRIGRFVIGPLDRQKLVYRCNKVICDFFDRYPNQFLKRFAIEGDPISVQVLDWPRLRDDFSIPPSDMASCLVDYYFECLTRNLQDSFRHEFQVAQEVLVAFGAPYLDLDRPQVWNGGTFVSIYQKIGKNYSGYFCPLGMWVSIDFAQADRRVPAKAEELKKNFSFAGLDSSEIRQTLGTYCRFILKAKVYESENRWDEAFLHYVIALDLLFGEKDASTQKVSKRTAIVVSRALSEEFLSIINRMKMVYEKRSKYVHAGISVSDEDMELVRPIIKEVLFCLLRLQSVQNNKKQGFIEAWLKSLDYFIAAAEAGKEIEEDDLVSAGIALSSA
jgi:Apea-like HEPN